MFLSPSFIHIEVWCGFCCASNQMSIFHFPTLMCSKIDASLWKFRRGINSNGNSFMPKCWDSIYVNLKIWVALVIGVKRMIDLNKALVSKLNWKISSKQNCLVTRFFLLLILVTIPSLGSGKIFLSPKIWFLKVLLSLSPWIRTLESGLILGFFLFLIQT